MSEIVDMNIKNTRNYYDLVEHTQNEKIKIELKNCKFKGVILSIGNLKFNNEDTTLLEFETDVISVPEALSGVDLSDEYETMFNDLIKNIVMNWVLDSLENYKTIDPETNETVYKFKEE